MTDNNVTIYFLYIFFTINAYFKVYDVVYGQSITIMFGLNCWWSYLETLIVVCNLSNILSKRICSNYILCINRKAFVDIIITVIKWRTLHFTFYELKSVHVLRMNSKTNYKDTPCVKLIAKTQTQHIFFSKTKIYSKLNIQYL